MIPRSWLDVYEDPVAAQPETGVQLSGFAEAAMQRRARSLARAQKYKTGRYVTRALTLGPTL
jgi:hypothetical protein